MTQTRLPRVPLGRTGRTVPAADMAAVRAYEASPQCAIDTAASFAREAEQLANEEGIDW